MLVLSFEIIELEQDTHVFFLAKIEINVFEKLVKNDIKTYKNIRKTITGQGDDYTTGCLLGYRYLKENCRPVIGRCKHQALNIDPKGM